MSSQPNLRIFIPRKEIADCVSRLAAEIEPDYRERNPLLVGILKGSFMFLSDLVRRLEFPLELDFMRISSYGGTQTTGKIRLKTPPACPVAGRHVLLVEDIVDTGLTTSFASKYLESKKPASLKLCALLDKPERRRVPVKIDYLGFSVPDQFLVGYGLDFDQQFRNLPDIHIVEESR